MNRIATYIAIIAVLSTATVNVIVTASHRCSSSLTFSRSLTLSTEEAARAAFYKKSFVRRRQNRKRLFLLEGDADDDDDEIDVRYTDNNLDEDHGYVSKKKCSRKSCFNHNLTGITNPLLFNKSALQKKLTSLISNDSDGNSDEKQIAQYKGWRVYRNRRVVGHGPACYQKVKDAALRWEDLHKNSDMFGIRMLYGNRGMTHTPVVSTGTNSRQVKVKAKTIPSKIRSNEDNDGDDVNSIMVYEERDPLRAPLLSERVVQITNSPGIKRLATFARMSLFNGRVKLPFWMVNPCMVLYDVVDERNHNGSTYSATAYATLKGHLLCGEERVLVAMSDRSSNEVSVEILSFSHATPSMLGRLVFAACRGMQTRFFDEEVDTLEKIAKSASIEDDQQSSSAGTLRVDLMQPQGHIQIHKPTSILRSFEKSL